MNYPAVASSVAAVLAGAAIAVSLTHAGPAGIPGPQGPRGERGAAGAQGPVGSPGTNGQTPYTSYDQVCWGNVQNQSTGLTGTYYYPCTPNVSINPQP